MTDATANSRTSDTRLRLLRAGVMVFAELGFEPASTRQLASQAGVNLAAIPYHFDNKKGLYLAVARYVAEQLSARVLPAIDAVAHVIDDPAAGDTALRTALHGIVERLATLILGEPEAENWAAFILREQAQPTEAFDIIYDAVMGRLYEIVTALIARLTNTDADDLRTRLRAVTLLGQILVFRTSRAGVLRSLEWDRYTPARVAQLRELILQQIDDIVEAERGRHG